MRIIGGTARGHPLKTPTGSDIRPTSDKVRLAIFNALYSRGAVAGATVIDAFCGTGALGLEALSQGAGAAHFFDMSKTSLTLAKENAVALRLADHAQFTLRDATKLGNRPEGVALATLVFLDPPYRKDLIVPTIEALQKGAWLAEGAWAVIESEKEWHLPPHFGSADFDKTYGETKVQFLQF